MTEIVIPTASSIARRYTADEIRAEIRRLEKKISVAGVGDLPTLRRTLAAWEDALSLRERADRGTE